MLLPVIQLEQEESEKIWKVHSMHAFNSKMGVGTIINLKHYILEEFLDKAKSVLIECRPAVVKIKTNSNS